MMICPKCNSQVEDNAVFCPNCGVRFTTGTEDTSAQTTVLTADMYPQFPEQSSQPVQPAQAAQPQYQQPAQNQYQQPQYQQPAQNQYQQAQYQQPYPQAPQYPQQPQFQQPYQQGGPVAQLKTNRSFLKTFLLSLVTLGIYGLICCGHMTDDVNLVCSRYDGKKTMNYYLLFFIVAPVTLGIGAIVWLHNFCGRIGNELSRRQIDYSFGAKDMWLWGVLGTFIVVGPFVFAHKLFKSVNLMNESYNQIG